MKTAMCLLLYTLDPNESTIPIADRLLAMGFDGLEWPVFGMDEAAAKCIAAYNEKNKLPAAAITAFGPEINPLAESTSERDASLEAFKVRIERAGMLGADILVGPLMQSLGSFTGAGPTADEWKRSVSFLQTAGDYAQKAGITLGLEPVNRFEIFLCNTAQAVSKLVDDIGHPNVQAMFDSFHANIEEKNLRTAVNTVGKRLQHIHISENDRGVPGSSRCIQWEDLFDGMMDINFDGWLSIESFTNAMPELAAATRIWRPMFEQADDVPSQGIKFMMQQWEAAKKRATSR